MPSPKKWTRSELLVALNIYHKLTFGQMDARNPVIRALAAKLERTPGSVGMKLCNFASFDPALQMRGIKGLAGASKLDAEVWNEFRGNLNETVPASEDAVRTLFEVPENAKLEIVPREGVRVHRRSPQGPTEATSTKKVRRGQEFFRDAVLNNFGGRCGVTGLAIRELLIASHILPWGKFESERLNVRNGLSLSRLHDAAFDQGLITFDDNLRLLLSPRLKTELAQRAVNENFVAYEGAILSVPEDAALPEPSFLAMHRSSVFQAN